ncbi:MAG: HPF/RaiA family ribosome-associated protein [Archangiaceae bacterium]|nr:HPF/RaiA family ribosome-associated protein [Archangiaceae bacterium]
MAERIQHEVAELEQNCQRITACRVVVELPHRHHQHGRQYQVKVEVSVPGRMLAVTHTPAEHHNAEDPYAAVNEAFLSMRRQLEDYVRVRQHRVKEHQAPNEGSVAKVLPSDDCGFIAADDGVEVYFHRNSVLDGGWQRIEVGDRVRFHAEQGDKGPQASSVHLLR